MGFSADHWRLTPSRPSHPHANFTRRWGDELSMGTAHAAKYTKLAWPVWSQC